MRLNPSVKRPISSFETTGARTSKRPCSTSTITASSRASGSATLRDTASASVTDTTMAATARNTTLTSMVAMMASALSAGTASACRARLCAITPRTATGITLIITNTTSRRTRTGSRGTPRTRVRPPSGKKSGSCRRHWRSAAKNMNAVAAKPAMTLIPKNERTALARPEDAGDHRPHHPPDQPGQRPANEVEAPRSPTGPGQPWRRTPSPAGPGGMGRCRRGRDQRLPSQLATPDQGAEEHDEVEDLAEAGARRVEALRDR